MTFCRYEKCPHWGQATKYPRKCYYEPQCWRGYLDTALQIDAAKNNLKWRKKKRVDHA